MTNFENLRNLEEKKTQLYVIKRHGSISKLVLTKRESK